MNLSHYTVTNNKFLSIDLAPKPNWKIGLAKDAIILHAYVKKPPNCFQRWMLNKFMGIEWSKI